MGEVATPELAAAVAEAGALGMLAQPALPPALLEEALNELGRRTTGPFGVSFLMPFLDRECVAVAAARARLVEFFYGDPEPALVETVHAAGAKAAWQVGSALEAVAAVDAGCDLVVAQGTEAGGHVRGRLGLLPLLSEVLEAVDVPVVAAGGIGTGRAMAGALAAGAAAVRVGTRFLAAAEANAHAHYVDLVIAAGGADTIVTETFSLMWPDAPHRVLRSAVERATAFDGEMTGETQVGAVTVPVARFSTLPPTRTTTGLIEAMALYAGESVGAVHSRQPAADIVRELWREAERLLEGWA